MGDNVYSVWGYSKYDKDINFMLVHTIVSQVSTNVAILPNRTENAHSQVSAQASAIIMVSAQSAWRISCT